MRSCPHCGARNSVKRTTCYQCREALSGAHGERASAARSRWEAIEPLPNRSSASQPISAPRPISSREEGAPAGQSDRPRGYVPQVRSSLRHARRMGVFFRELHNLTRPGISIAAACRELERRAPRGLREMAREMAAAAESGRPISSVLQQHRSLLYPWHIGVVRAAEAGGFLPEAFDQVAHGYEVEWETRSAFRVRLFVYTFFGLPAILVTIPAVLTLAEPIPRDGWTPNLVLQSLWGHLLRVSLPIACSLVALVIIWQALSATAWFQEVQQRIVVRLPVVGRMAKTTALDRYLATLGLMLRGGLPVAEAAEEAALAAGHVVLTPKLLEIAPGLRQGVPLSSLLAETRVFDGDTLSMATTGEASGSLPDMLVRAAGYHRQDNEAKRKMLLRAALITIGVTWLSLMGVLIAIAMRTYFDFVFRVEDWMME